MGLISNLYFAFYGKESFDVPVILHFIFFFWFLDHAPQNISTYQNIYPREYGKTFKVVLFKKNLIFCNKKLKCLKYLKQIRKAKRHFKTQFLIIFSFFYNIKSKSYKNIGVFFNLIFAIYEKKMFLCTMHSVFHFCFWTMPLI